MVDGQAGKGDRYRSVNFEKWDEGWEAAFGKKTKKKKEKKNGRSKIGKTTNGRRTNRKN